MKMPKSRFHSSTDLKQYASEYKNQLFSKFQNQLLQNTGTVNNININNININGGINHNNSHNNYFNNNYNGNYDNMYDNYGINQVNYEQQTIVHPQYSKWGNNNHGNFTTPQELTSFSPISKPLDFGGKVYDAADSQNVSFDGSNEVDFFSLRLDPKRRNSASNLNINAAKYTIKKKTSLFMNSEADKGDDFDSLDALIESLNGTMWDYAKTQRGSRNLQKLINEIQPSEIDKILEICKNNFYDLMTNVYGNYFCQKLIQCCSSEQRVFILRNVNNF